MITTKRCIGCKEFLPLEEFHWASRKLNYRSPRCSKCTSAGRRERLSGADGAELLKAERARSARWRSTEKGQASRPKRAAAQRARRAGPDGAKILEAERLSAEARRKTPRGRFLQRTYQVRGQFGLEYHEHWALLEYQAHKCAICDRDVDLYSPIDHDHKTNKVRGVLCSHHNAGLGQFGDDPKGLRRAATYVERAQMNQ
mgnify:FL=1